VDLQVNNMIKKQSIPIVLLVLISLVTLLGACSSDAAEEPTAVETPDSEPTMTPADEEPEPGATEVDEVEETLTPQASELTAVIVGGDIAGTGKPFTFDATQSQVGEEAIAAYVWNMGDGTTLFGLSAEHAYNEPGFYTVTLTITDEDGQTDTAAKVVEVLDLEEDATPTAEGEFTLIGTSWLMNNAVRGTTVTLEFDEELLSGSAGCNSYSAGFTTTVSDDPASSISVNTISVTNQVCTSEVMAQEKGYLDSLASANSYTIDGTTLILETGSGTLTFRMASE
jgi:heat shock protein HslJ